MCQPVLYWPVHPPGPGEGVGAWVRITATESPKQRGCVGAGRETPTRRYRSVSAVPTASSSAAGEEVLGTLRVSLYLFPLPGFSGNTRRRAPRTAALAPVPHRPRPGPPRPA